MIAFRNSGEDSSSDDKLDKDKIKKSLQKLLDIIHNDPEFYPGSHHEDVDISYVIQAIYQILFEEKNHSIHLIVDRKQNESLDLTIDKIE
jgi:hypothetical protein